MKKIIYFGAGNFGTTLLSNLIKNFMSFRLVAIVDSDFYESSINFGTVKMFESDVDFLSSKFTKMKNLFIVISSKAPEKEKIITICKEMNLPFLLEKKEFNDSFKEIVS